MSQELAIVPVGTSLLQIAEILAESRQRYVLVTDLSGSLVGVVGGNDLLKYMTHATQGDKVDWQSKRVESVMATKFVTSSPDAAADDVAPLIAKGSIQCVPVLEGKELVGVLTSDDLLLSWNRLDPLLKEAATDSVTDLASRATFDRRLIEEWNRAKRQGGSLGLILVDVDHFKTINDTCGHLTGDAVLCTIGSCLKRHLRTYDVVARYGGDEFAAICCDCRPADIEVPIARLQEGVRALSAPSELGQKNITLSIGAAVVRGDFDPFGPKDLIEAADRCLYQAKTGGRDRAYQTSLSPENRPECELVQVQ
jgi:diguanylate cyclase (GGDEF)-like protein